MKEKFVNYEIALALKELGFDEECGAFYFKDLENIYQKCCEWFVSNDDVYYYGEEILCVAPLYQQAFRWFREKHDLDVISKPHIRKTKKYVCDPVNIRLEAKNTYEEAETACLIKLIEIVKKK